MCAVTSHPTTHDARALAARTHCRLGYSFLLCLFADERRKSSSRPPTTTLSFVALLKISSLRVMGIMTPISKRLHKTSLFGCRFCVRAGPPTTTRGLLLSPQRLLLLVRTRARARVPRYIPAHAATTAQDGLDGRSVRVRVGSSSQRAGRSFGGLFRKSNTGKEENMQTQQDATRFNDFVLSTCSPSHVRSARMGVIDWVRLDGANYYSPSSGLRHVCDPATCGSWVLRLADGAKICAISGNLLLTSGDTSPRKRPMHVDVDQDGKKHQDKPIPGSSAYLSEKFGLGNDRCDDMMAVEDQNSNGSFFGTGVRMNSYPLR